VPEKNPNHDSDSEKILLDIYKRKLNKRITGYVPYQHEMDTWGLENGNTRYTIDFNKPLDQVLAEVKRIYKFEALQQEAQQKGMSPSPEQFWEILAEQDEYFLNSSDEGFMINYDIRAVGLWLWDFKEHYKNCSVREAIRNLDKTIDFESIGFSSVDNDKYGPDNEWDLEANPETTYRTLNRYYKTTDECIKKMKILPIKK